MPEELFWLMFRRAPRQARDLLKANPEQSSERSRMGYSRSPKGAFEPWVVRKAG